MSRFAAAKVNSVSSRTAAPTVPTSTSTDTAPRAARSARLLTRLTVGLMDTFNLINDSYYATKRIGGRDDRDSNYEFVIGEILHNKFRIDAAIGKGSFGKVVRCTDLRQMPHNAITSLASLSASSSPSSSLSSLSRSPSVTSPSSRHVAVKLIKSKAAFYKQSQTEVAVLKSIRSHGAASAHCVELLETFSHCGHHCLVFELLDQNLYEAIRATRFNGFPLPVVSYIGSQIANALSALRECGIIHCDLKPENVLLVRPTHIHNTTPATSYNVKVIDFGSATFDNSPQRPTTYIQSRFYRAPEICMSLSYDHTIDVWSLGCILFELITGRPLFDGQNENEQMIKHCQVLGPPPYEMVLASKKAQKIFDVDHLKRTCSMRKKVLAKVAADHRNNPRTETATNTSTNTISSTTTTTSLNTIMSTTNPSSSSSLSFPHNLIASSPIEGIKRALGNKYENNMICNALVDIIYRMTHYHSGQRITARQAITHTFFTMFNNTSSLVCSNLSSSFTSSNLSSASCSSSLSTTSLILSSSSAMVVPLHTTSSDTDDTSTDSMDIDIMTTTTSNSGTSSKNHEKRSPRFVAITNSAVMPTAAAETETDGSISGNESPSRVVITDDDKNMTDETAPHNEHEHSTTLAANGDDNAHSNNRVVTRSMAASSRHSRLSINTSYGSVGVTTRSRALPAHSIDTQLAAAMADNTHSRLRPRQRRQRRADEMIENDHENTHMNDTSDSMQSGQHGGITSLPVRRSYSKYTATRQRKSRRLTQANCTKTSGGSGEISPAISHRTRSHIHYNAVTSMECDSARH